MVLPILFQSTRPLRGATVYFVCAKFPPDFNPRAPCGARLGAIVDIFAVVRISIHAPLAGRDGKSDEFSPADLRK